MAIGFRSVDEIVAQVVEASPLPANLADLHPHLRNQIEAEAKAENIRPDYYWRDYRVLQMKEAASLREAQEIARNARRR